MPMAQAIELGIFDTSTVENIQDIPDGLPEPKLDPLASLEVLSSRITNGTIMRR